MFEKQTPYQFSIIHETEPHLNQNEVKMFSET